MEVKKEPENTDEKPIRDTEPQTKPPEPPKQFWSAPKGGITFKENLAAGEPGNEVFCVRYSNDNSQLAAGTASGAIRLYNAASGKLISTMSGPSLPITCLRWKPQEGEAKSSTILTSVCSNGDITYWHAPSGKSIISIQEDTPVDLYALDFSRDGGLLAVGGKDYDVKIYDDSTKSLVSVLKAANTVSEGHSNRVFSVKFTEDPNLILSGGWDNCVFIWDIREKKSVGLLYGPHICGDAVDLKGDMVLTGSYSNKEVLQLWSFSKRSLITKIPWNGNAIETYDHGFLYAAMFEKAKGKYIAAGGAGKNEVHVFRDDKDHDLLGKIGFDNTVTSVDFAHGKNAIAVGCGNGLAYSFSIGF